MTTDIDVDVDIDEADIFVLSQGLQNSSRLTFDINKSLQKIAKTSGQSSELFTPILSRNNMLVTLQRNIESTLNSVASVKDLANEASKYEIILRKGIKQVGLKQYTQVMHKVDDMLEDIKISNEQNAEFHGILSHLTELIKESEGELRLYFISILNIIKPFDPQINMNKKIPFPYYEDQQLAEMSWILDYFYNNSEGSVIQTVFVQQQSNNILKCMAFLEPFVKQITSSKNAPYEKGSNGMLSYTEALIGFIANEKSLVDDLYSQYAPLKSEILVQTLTPLLVAYSKLFQSNLKLVESNLENVGIYSFELVESVQAIIKALKFNSSLENHPDITECSIHIRRVTQSLFKNAIERINTKVKMLSSIPSDNGVTEPTVDTMSRLRRFSEYKNGCLNAMEGMKREDWLVMSPNDKASTYTPGTLQGNGKDNNAALISCFFSDCIDTLVSQLEERAKSLLASHPDSEGGSKANRHKQRIGFFILMNISLVEQIIEKSELNVLLGGEGHNRLEKLKKKAIGYMIADWRDLTANLMDSVFIDSTGKKSKDKDQIKEKFKRFNEGFEDLVSKTKQYRLSDPNLKKILKSEIISLVMPMYERFYSRYKDTFKNPRKHIKYTPDELTTVLNQLVR